MPTSRTLLTATILIFLGGTLVGCGESVHRSPTVSAAAPLPKTPAAAFEIPTPRSLKDTTDLTSWAPVETSTLALRKPSEGSGVVVKLRRLTPEGTANLVTVLGRHGRPGAQWLRIRVATLPRNRTAWVPESALGTTETVGTHLFVDRHRHTATLYDEGRRVFQASVGVGRPATPTPAGEFYVRDKLTKFHSRIYGPVAFGTSARSATLTEWPAGGFIGLHGTDEPQILPGAVSHGCIRFTNPDIERLARLMPIGTPLTIR